MRTPLKSIDRPKRLRPNTRGSSVCDLFALGQRIAWGADGAAPRDRRVSPRPGSLAVLHRARAAPPRAEAVFAVLALASEPVDPGSKSCHGHVPSPQCHGPPRRQRGEARVLIG